MFIALRVQFCGSFDRILCVENLCKYYLVFLVFVFLFWFWFLCVLMVFKLARVHSTTRGQLYRMAKKLLCGSSKFEHAIAQKWMKEPEEAQKQNDPKQI